MEDDPLLSYVQNRRQAPAVGQTGDDDDPLLSYAQNRRQQPQDSRRRVEGKLGAGLTALVSGLPGMEAIGGAVSALTGGTYQGGRRDIARMQQESKEKLGTVGYEALRLAPEIAASFTPIGRATRAGRAAFAGGVEAVRGASRAGMEREEAPSAGEVAREAATSGALGFAGSVAGEKVMAGLGRVGRRAAESGVGQSIVRGRRTATDFLRSPEVQATVAGLPGVRTAANLAARVLDPIDAARVQRTASGQLRPSGETVGMAEEQATQAGRRFQESLRQAQEEAGSVRRLAREQARAVQTSEVQSGNAAIRAARDEAEAIIERANARLAEAIPTGEVSGSNALRETIRAEQLAAGRESYTQAYALAGQVPPYRVAGALKSAIETNPVVRRAYTAVRNASRDVAEEFPELSVSGSRPLERMTEAVEGMQALPAFPNGVPSLEALDRMRQEVSAYVMSRAGGEGISRQQAREAWQAISQVEDAYLNAIPREASEALRASRAQYRQYFERLEALADGRNLSSFGAGKKEGAVTASRVSLDELERRMTLWSPDAQEAFKVGAKQWVNDQIARGANPLQLARQFAGTPEKARRARLALGDETVNQLELALGGVRGAVREARASVRLPSGETVKEAAQANVGRARALGREQIDEASQLAQDIMGRAEAGRPMVERLRGEVDILRRARDAYNNPEEAMTFMQTVWPALSPAMQQRVSGSVGTSLVARLQGKTVPQAQAILQEVQQNPAARAMLGDALRNAELSVGRLVPGRTRFGSVLGASTASGLRNIER